MKDAAREYADRVRDLIRSYGQDLSETNHARIILAYRAGKEAGMDEERMRWVGAVRQAAPKPEGNDDLENEKT